MHKGTNTNPIDNTNLKDANLIELMIYLDDKVQTMEKPSVLTNKYSMIDKATQVHEEDIMIEVGQENHTIIVISRF